MSGFIKKTGEWIRAHMQDIVTICLVVLLLAVSVEAFMLFRIVGSLAEVAEKAMNLVKMLNDQLQS
jgi:hypothetical protein